MRSFCGGYSLALGSAEVSLLNLTNAYRALGNGGRYSPTTLTVRPATSTVRPTSVSARAAASIVRPEQKSVRPELGLS
ncbi:hypothetical protein [Rhodoferax sp. UBA5149]|uniref:hypothetical protein n=1 Tax=Rhodoferax sp. UBA5149 TaxID=1947379 RepID=UPI0039C97E61